MGAQIHKPKEQQGAWKGKNPFGTWMERRIKGEIAPLSGTVVFAHDWGNDGAQTNIELLVRNICKGARCNVDFLTIPGLSPLGSPIRAALELDRMLDTNLLSIRASIAVQRRIGSKIAERLPRIALVNVYDREVGSKREPVIATGKIKICDEQKPLWIKVGLVGPFENGIISYLGRRIEDLKVNKIENQILAIERNCATWDGRALFGPAAAWFVSGVNGDYFGDQILETEKYPKIVLAYSIERDKVKFDVIDVDAIGNVVSSIPNSEFDKLPAKLVLNGNRKIIISKGTKFSDVAQGSAVFYRGSNGFIEFAINCSRFNEIAGIDSNFGSTKEGGQIRSEGKVELQIIG